MSALPHSCCLDETSSVDQLLAEARKAAALGEIIGRVLVVVSRDEYEEDYAAEAAFEAAWIAREALDLAIKKMEAAKAAAESGVA